MKSSSKQSTDNRIVLIKVKGSGLPAISLVLFEDIKNPLFDYMFS